MDKYFIQEYKDGNGVSYFRIEYFWKLFGIFKIRSCVKKTLPFNLGTAPLEFGTREAAENFFIEQRSYERHRVD